MSRYDKLFSSYVDEIRVPHQESLRWWEGLLAESAAKAGSMQGAEALVRARWPAGPVSHPRVIGVFRKYYLLCDSMNEALRDKWEASHNQKKREVDGDLAWGQDDEKKGEEGTQEPYFLLVERLELEDKELGKFIGGLLFIPIGIDDEGKVN